MHIDMFVGDIKSSKSLDRSRYQRLNGGHEDTLLLTIRFRSKEC